MAKREGPTAQANQNVEELPSSVQGCTVARAGAGGGGPHGTTAPTSATPWVPQATAPSSSSQMAVQSDSAASTGVVFRAIASTQDPSEDEAFVAPHLSSVDVFVSAGIHASALG